MQPETRKTLLLVTAIALFIALCIIFPRMLAFARIAGREMRIFWWLILLAGLGIYFSFLFGRKKK